MSNNTRLMIEIKKELKNDLLKVLTDSGLPFSIKENPEDNNSESINEYRIVDFLTVLGMPANLCGYEYLKSAAKETLDNPTYLRRNVTSKLYPKIALDHGTKSSCVERAIRHAISATWDRGNAAELDKHFGTCISERTGKVSNSVFIAKMVESVKRK